MKQIRKRNDMSDHEVNLVWTKVKKRVRPDTLVKHKALHAYKDYNIKRILSQSIVGN